MALSALSRLLPVALASLLAAASLPELFQQAKQEFKLGSYDSALKTLERLDEESAKPGLERDRQTLLPALYFYRGASLAALGRSREAGEAFEAFLALKPDVHVDPAVYPKRVIDALEGARRAVAARQTQPAESGLLAAAYRAFVPPAGQPEESAKENWSEGPARWLLTAPERRTYESLTDAVSRSEFIANFWKSRDPKPETPENELRQEFDRRVAFADARFAQDEVRGSLTDRGMVFVLLGPPSYSGRKLLQTGDDVADASGLSRYTPAEIRASQQPSGSNSAREERMEKTTGPGSKILDAVNNWMESWHYLRDNLPREIPNQELVFNFVTKQGYGKNVLQRESDTLTALERAKALAKRS
jgi:GWxTD domain-containing protein